MDLLMYQKNYGNKLWMNKVLKLVLETGDMMLSFIWLLLLKGQKSFTILEIKLGMKTLIRLEKKIKNFGMPTLDIIDTTLLTINM